LTPTEFLTQNEIDAAKSVRVGALNVQTQEMIQWTKQFVVAKAYIDQLERSQALPTDQIASLRNAIQKAESTKNAKDVAAVKGQSGSIEKAAGTAKSALDAGRPSAVA